MVKRLKQLRNEMGISQQRLAETLKISQPAINKYENHNIEPDIDILCRMAAFFQTSVDYLIGNTDIRSKIEQTAPFDLNQEESEVISGFRILTPQEKDCIKTTIQLFTKNKTE